MTENISQCDKELLKLRKLYLKYVGTKKIILVCSELPKILRYEGDSICNEMVPINQKVLDLYTLQLHSQKDLLLGYTTAKSQLSIISLRGFFQTLKGS